MGAVFGPEKDVFMGILQKRFSSYFSAFVQPILLWIVWHISCHWDTCNEAAAQASGVTKEAPSCCTQSQFFCQIPPGIEKNIQLFWPTLPAPVQMGWKVTTVYLKISTDSVVWVSNAKFGIPWDSSLFRLRFRTSLSPSPSVCLQAFSKLGWNFFPLSCSWRLEHKCYCWSDVTVFVPKPKPVFKKVVRIA